MKALVLGGLAVSLIAAAPASRQQAPSAEIAIGKSIQAGMPADTSSAFDAAVGQVAGWTRVTGLAAGSKITHAWIHGGDTSKVELNVGGSPWRTYSRKNVSAGEWTLEVWDADGKKLGARTFRVG
jgi:hypothetical protein